ncbi:alpha/beta hydrolase [Sandaracinobacteroides saxicola]|uniref:Alpha/beta hydrolase n=1 Tax=Sandaracinobacteroides saxicola TaxID=2759707 RepID=A0A7G5ILJ6_9SPHN|nr:alpha/beta hydrolase [Sandaracinobacteroides saxicola]QMW24238.1 alpha/beta hydrolase [Sandaracinobacteroides saxicola]
MTEPRFHLPADAWVGTVAAADGWPLRVMLATAEAPRGVLLFLNGRADFLEKWAEVYPDFLAAGWSVLSLDWRGQGRSGRLSGNGAGQIDDFATFVSDLDMVARWARARPGLAALPWVAAAHSMGGHILLRWLAGGGGAMLHRAVLLAPMCGLVTPRWMQALAGIAAAWRRARGQGEGFAWGQVAYGGRQQGAARRLLLTSDARRFADEHDWLARDPALALGGVSWNWLHAAQASFAVLARADLTAVRLPLLMLLAEREALVSNAAARAVASRLAHCRLRMISGAAHELLREAEPMRGEALRTLLDFVDVAARVEERA